MTQCASIPRRLGLACPAMQGECGSAVSPDEDDLCDVAAIRRGDEQAFARIIVRHERAIQVQMSRYTRDATLRRELVQEVFVAAYYALPGFRGDAPFSHWLRRIATRTGYRHWTRESRLRRVSAAAESAHRTPISTEPSNEGAAALLEHILAHLAPKDRLVLMLHYLESCPVAEIAAQCGWSETLVRVRLHRARIRLRKLIDSNPAWKEAL